MKVEKKQKRVMEGEVIKAPTPKTVVVRVKKVFLHPLYRKYYRIAKRYKAHDPESKCKVGDKVIIRESRPISREKRWVVEKVFETSDGLKV